MPGHAAVFGETVYGFKGEGQGRQGRLGSVILNLQEGGCTSRPNPHCGPLLIETCDVAVVVIDEADVKLENSVTDFEGCQLSLAPFPADAVQSGQSVQTFCPEAGQVRGKVSLLGFTSRESAHICDCIGLLRDDGHDGQPLHGSGQSGLLVTDVPAKPDGRNDAVVKCLAMLVALQTIATDRQPTRVYSLAVPMSRVFQRLGEQPLFQITGRPSFVSPLKTKRTRISGSSPVSAVNTVDLLEDSEGVQINAVGDMSTVPTPSHV